MKNFFCLCLTGSLLLALNSQAQEISSTAAVSKESSTMSLGTSGLTNKKYEDSKEITDPKIRADAGSLSKYSLKFNLSYFGPTIGDLSAKDQPNPDSSIGPSQTALSGSVGMRYRTASNRSFSMGTGLKAIHPLHGMERFDANNPYLNYDMTSRAESGIQMRNSPGISYITVPEYTQVGEVASASYDFSAVYNFTESRFAAGLDASVAYFFYNRPYEVADRGSSRSSFALYPTFKYIFSDKWNITTSTALTWLSPRSRSNETVLLNKTVTQRIGLGYAWSRDIYLNPYVQVLPTRASWDTTTMNLSTSFSIL